MQASRSKIVLVTGVFDILHQEHLLFLQKAQALGDRLVIGLESDARVRQLKGSARPINPERVRVANLEKLQLADEVFILPENFSEPDDHRALLKKIKPTILAVSEQSPHILEKRNLMEEIGGRVVVVHKHNPAISTTQILAVQKKSLQKKD